MDISHASAYTRSILPELEDQIPEAWQQQNSDAHLGRPLSFGEGHGVTGFNTNSVNGYMNAPQLRNPLMVSGGWDSKLSYLAPDSAPNGIGGSATGISGNDHFMHSGFDHVDEDTSFRKMLMTSPQRYPEMEPLLGRSVNPHIGSTKDSLSMPGMNLATSDCLMNFTADPGFADRAARFSPFGSVGSRGAYFDVGKSMDTATNLSQGKIVSQQHIVSKSSVPNSPNNINVANASGAQDPNTFPVKEAASKMLTEDPLRRTSLSAADCSNGAQKQHCTSINESDESIGQEVSSSCERNNGGAAPASASQGMTEGLGRKRKAGSRQKPKDGGGPAANIKDADTDEGKTKLQKGGDGGVEKCAETKVEPTNSANSGESTPKSGKEGSKPPEPPKPDYIHVRARRGQATDSHSLAERVRREKISERMKYLQDLVPGCSKVTGKAVMLDEIINYVQSLQRQVEFLSMKLAAVNPRVEFNIDNLFARERAPPGLAAPPLHFAPEGAPAYPSLHHNQQLHPSMQVLAPCPPIHSFASDPAVGQTVPPPRPMDGYGDSVPQHVNQAWDELQSLVQMGYGQGRQTPLASPDLPGQLFPGQMKVEH